MFFFNKPFFRVFRLYLCTMWGLQKNFDKKVVVSIFSVFSLNTPQSIIVDVVVVITRDVVGKHTETKFRREEEEKSWGYRQFHWCDAVLNQSFLC